MNIPHLMYSVLAREKPVSYRIQPHPSESSQVTLMVISGSVIGNFPDPTSATTHALSLMTPYDSLLSDWPIPPRCTIGRMSITRFSTHIDIDMLVIKYTGLGALYEKPGVLGTSHLIEHLMVRSLPESLLADLERHSIEYNAYTSESEVMVFFRGILKHYRQFEQPLLDHFSKVPACSEAQFDTEKSVVLQEYQDSFRDPTEASFINIGRERFGYAGPLGLREDIEGFSYQQYLDTLTGLKPEAYILSKRFEGTYPKLEMPKLSNPRPQFEVPGDRRLPKEKPQGSFFERLFRKTDQTVTCLTNIIPSQLEPISDFIVDALNSGMTSPLFVYLRNDLGLVYDSGSSFYDLGQRGHVISFHGTSSNPSGLKKAYKEFFKIENLRTVLTRELYERTLFETQVARDWSLSLPHSDFFSRFADGRNSYDSSDEDFESVTYEKVLEVLETLSFEVV